MSHNLRENERELIKLVNFFRKHAEKLSNENKQDEEFKLLIDTCEKFAEQLNMHAARRDDVIMQREQLKNLVRDNALCPKCTKNTHLKFVGVDTHPEGWKCNKYKCRKCNIGFVWSRPNNPWDMIPYVEGFVSDLEKKIQSDEMGEEEKQAAVATIAQMHSNIDKLKPVIEASDLDYRELQEREEEMAKMIHEFKNHLLIIKIKMDTWESRKN
ncbi:MAG TPA: hypothetical protein VF868_09060 [Bacteroidia bacterium]|jgi:hypothetical protein